MQRDRYYLLGGDTIVARLRRHLMKVLEGASRHRMSFFSRLRARARRLRLYTQSRRLRSRWRRQRNSTARAALVGNRKTRPLSQLSCASEPHQHTLDRGRSR